MTAGQRGPLMMQDIYYLEQMAHFDREVIPERRMHAKGSGRSERLQLRMILRSTHQLRFFRSR